MLNDFKNKYLKLYRELKKQQWKNYFEEGDCDLDIVDEGIYSLVSEYEGRIEASNREGMIANLIIAKEKVDRNPNVSKLRNYIDNLENYNIDIPKEIKEDNYKYRLYVANKMKKDVLKLMEIRDYLALENGYESYPDLVLKTNGLNSRELNVLLNNYLEKNLNKARKIIKKYNISLENWFEDLDKISGEYNDYCSDMIVEKLLTLLGISETMESLEIKYIDDGFSGYATELAVNDIRIAVAPIKSLNDLRILFHELGHAISYSLNNEEGLFRILPPSLDEAMAVIFEYLACIFVLNEEDKMKINELMILEYTRCAVSALYEFDLWKNPDRAEELFEYQYNKLGLKVNDSGIWAYDSFRSIDPVYIHNYVIGASIAENLVEYLDTLYSIDYESWGKWLHYNIYFVGWRRNIRDKFEQIKSGDEFNNQKRYNGNFTELI